MMSSESGKRRGWRVGLAALALGTIAAAGIAAAPAKADDGWHRGWERGDWRRDHDWDRDRDAWRWGWHGPGWYGYRWYNSPPVVYAPPAPPVVAYPPAYPVGSLNVYIPLR